MITRLERNDKGTVGLQCDGRSPSQLVTYEPYRQSVIILQLFSGMLNGIADRFLSSQHLGFNGCSRIDCYINNCKSCDRPGLASTIQSQHATFDDKSRSDIAPENKGVANPNRLNVTSRKNLDDFFESVIGLQISRSRDFQRFRVCFGLSQQQANLKRISFMLRPNQICNFMFFL